MTWFKRNFVANIFFHPACAYWLLTYHFQIQKKRRKFKSSHDKLESGEKILSHLMEDNPAKMNFKSSLSDTQDFQRSARVKAKHKLSN